MYIPKKLIIFVREFKQTLHKEIQNTMKKSILTAAAAIITAFSANAQSGYEDTKHEVGISFGWGSTSQFFDTFETITKTIVGAKCGDEQNFGPLSAEYFFHATTWLSTGAVVVYGKQTQDLYIGNNKKGKEKNSYYTLLPALKFNFLRKDYFGMYSKVALGATLRSEKTEFDSNDYEGSKLHFNWQISFLGIEAGGQKFRGFSELGFGEQGVFCLGIRYKF